MDRYLVKTHLLDFEAENIQQLVESRHWRTLSENEKVKSIYNFVRDEIEFGFNEDDSLTASSILRSGYGQCNTKSILFMALLRALQIPCRLHGFTIDKTLQKGIMNGMLYERMPKEISHTWVEAYIDGQWHNFEGVILDLPYLSALQKKYADHNGVFIGYGVAIEELQSPPVEWNGNNDTYIQRAGITQDFGLFDDPDSFFAKHSQKLSDEDKALFANNLRHKINKNITKIRQQNFSELE